MFNFLRKRFNSNETPINEKKLLKQYGECRNLSNHIRLLIITDTHGYLTYKKDSIEMMKNPENYDFCCCLGDIAYNDYEVILQYVPKEKMVAILGNHDDMDVIKHFDIKDLNGEVVTVNGVKIGGIQGSYKYNEFKAFPSFTQEESIEFLEKMEAVDILISHAGPFQNVDIDPVHRGLKGITQYLYKNKVPYNIHGHNHNTSDSYLLNGTKVMERYFVEMVEL